MFDISVSGQKSNPFSVTAQNELAKDLYNLGMFNPQMAKQALLCLEMMNFEGKEKIVERIKENAESVQNITPPANDGSHMFSKEGNLVDAYRKNLPGKAILDSLKGELI